MPDSEVAPGHEPGQRPDEPVPPRPDRQGRGPLHGPGPQRARRGRRAAVGHAARVGRRCGSASPFVLLVGQPPPHHPRASRPSARWWRSASSPLDLLRAWASGWRTRRASGPRRPPPPPSGCSARSASASSGAMGLLRTVLTLGLIPLGALVRLPAARRPPGSRWAQIACLLVYVTVPAALQRARRRPLGRARCSTPPRPLHRRHARPGQPASRPFGPVGGADGVRRAGAVAGGGQVLALGFVTALVATLLPVAVVVVVVMAARHGARRRRRRQPRGRPADARRRRWRRRPSRVVLHLPWSLDFLLPGTTLSSLHRRRRAPASRPTSPALLRFEVGPLGGAPLGWCFLVAAALPLLIGRAERHAWAVRGLDAGGRVLRRRVGGAAGHARRSPSRPSTCCSCRPPPAWRWPPPWAWRAFEVDLPGLPLRLAPDRVRGGGGRGRRRHRPGARRLLRRPVVDAGRRPRPRACRFIDAENDETPVPRAVARRPRRPPARRLGARATASPTAPPTTASPTLENLWVGSDDGRHRPAADALDLARSGQTARLGRLLAPMGVRYVVVPERLAPDPFATEELPVPGGRRRHPRRPARPRARRRARRAHRVPQPGLPPDAGRRARRRSRCPSTAASPRPPPRPLRRARRAARRRTAAQLVRARRRRHHRAPLGGAAPTAGSSRSTARPSTRIEPFGWANGFEVTDGGDATLRFHTSPLRYGLLARAGAGVAVGAPHASSAGASTRADRPTGGRRHEVVPAHRPRPARRRHRRRAWPLEAADDRRRPTADADPAGRRPASPCRPPTPRATLSSTWYCAGGTASDGGLADHVAAHRQPHRRGPHGHRHRRCPARSRPGPPSRPTEAARRPRPRTADDHDHRRPRPRPPRGAAAPRRPQVELPAHEPGRGGARATSSTRRSPARSSRSTAARSPSSTRSPTCAERRRPGHRAVQLHGGAASGRSRGASPPRARGSCSCS